MTSLPIHVLTQLLISNLAPILSYALRSSVSYVYPKEAVRTVLSEPDYERELDLLQMDRLTRWMSMIFFDDDEGVRPLTTGVAVENGDGNKRNTTEKGRKEVGDRKEVEVGDGNGEGVRPLTTEIEVGVGKELEHGVGNGNGRKEVENEIGKETERAYKKELYNLYRTIVSDFSQYKEWKRYNAGIWVLSSYRKKNTPALAKKIIGDLKLFHEGLSLFSMIRLKRL